MPPVFPVFFQDFSGSTTLAHAFIGKPEFMAELKAELGPEITAEHGDLLLFEHAAHPAFALDAWPDAQVLEFESISSAAKALKKLGKLWLHHPVECVRRGTLVSEQLRKLPPLDPLDFPAPRLPRIGGFSLVGRNSLIACASPWKRIPGGRFRFREDKSNPPNRAYLKLREALTLTATVPKPGDTCLDLGASPGGWTWVLQGLGAKVIAVDKAPLDSRIASLPGVTALEQSAFAMDPRDFDSVDWLVCDVICYPERLFAMLSRWIESGKAGRIVATIKLQGKTDFEWIRRFQGIPGASVTHLWHNRHELTFFLPGIGLKLVSPEHQIAEP